MNLNLALVWAGFVTIPLLLDPMEGNPFEDFTISGFISGEGLSASRLWALGELSVLGGCRSWEDVFLLWGLPFRPKAAFLRS